MAQGIRHLPAHGFPLASCGADAMEARPCFRRCGRRAFGPVACGQCCLNGLSVGVHVADRAGRHPSARPWRLRPSEAIRQPRPFMPSALTLGSWFVGWPLEFQAGRRHAVATTTLTLEIRTDPVRGGGGGFAPSS